MERGTSGEDAYLRLLGEVIDLARHATTEELQVVLTGLTGLISDRQREEQEKTP